MSTEGRAASFKIMAAFCFLLFLPPMGHAQERVLAFDQALELARRRAPSILSAKARVEEARGRLRGASILLQQNPQIETEAGPRTSDRGRSADVDVGISQGFELGGRRNARIAGAQAGVDREIASSEEATRRLLREVAASFLRALTSQERMRLLAEAEQIAAEFLRIAEHRYQAGDIPILEVNLARTSTARARSELQVASADFASALGELRVLLGMAPGESLAVRGDLRDRPSYELDFLLARAQTERPDLRALGAELREAEADVRLGEGFKWPDLGISGRYQREEGANVVQGGLKITLPVFSSGQELRATGSARAARIRLELVALSRAIEHEIKAALEAYELRTNAANELEKGALPSLAENETLARRGYEEGELGLLELLLVRREILETRLAYLSSLLEMRLAAIEVEFRAGALK